MADGPDISKVINLIMENPELLAQISAMVKKSDSNEQTEEASAEIAEEPTEPVSEPVVPSSLITDDISPRRQNRTKLLYAMKPYLKESRRGAIDTMISIVDILDVMRRK